MNNYNMFQLVNYAINKDINGNAFSVDEFNNVLNVQSLRHFKKKLGLPEEYQPNAPIPRQGVDVTTISERDLLPFLVSEKVTLTSAAVDVSEKNIAFLITAAPSPQTGYACDALTSSEYYERSNNPITTPTAYYPAYSWYSETSLKFLPTTLTSVNLKYYTFPTEAEAIITADDTTLLPVYDEDDSTELQWDDVNKMDIIYNILRSAGVNLERTDVLQYANNVIKTGD